MRIYEFPVHGASPGVGGLIVVVAAARSAAIGKANREILRMNTGRATRKQPPVYIDPDECVTKGTLPENGGVVYSYSGEA